MKILTYLLLLLYSTTNAQNAHEGTPGFIVLCDFKTPYEVRVDSLKKVIQIGSFKSLAEYHILDDTITSEGYTNKELQGVPIAKSFSILSHRKNIPKNYKKNKKSFLHILRIMFI